MTHAVLAWHFLREDWTTGKGGLLVEPGTPLIHTGALAPCSSGLHASRRAIDALAYAPSSLITSVECLDPFVENGDKFVCTKRTALWGYAADEELAVFARRCATSVLDKWDAPDVVKEWLETGDEAIGSAAASAAAYAAASYASYAAYSAASAAQSAAHSAAAADAASYAARYAVNAAAQSYAFYAAANATAAAAKNTQNEVLESLLMDGAIHRGLIK